MNGATEVVCIYFQEEEINELFSDLLRAHGARTRILSDISQAPQDTRVITEPQFFPQLNPSLWRRCLVVGNKESLKGIDTLCLSRPLTESKIEAALKNFLSLA
ncbi:MAG: hypothetical protein DCC75_08395 [Proteobacteria bacterium]|nr:MAG: hypothetical protein DCC75_08395 [Pseudomonadota bacterium]